MPMLHSIYDLTTLCRKTSGDVPPKLVGASTTVVGKKMYLFGGRLVAERKIVADMYAFDMESFSWERMPTHPDDHVPRHRYFHSTDTWNNHLVVFGGMTNKPDSSNPDDLCVLNDVHFFDLLAHRWVPGPDLSQSPEANIPRGRYAHLSAVTADKLFIIGGQDFYNTWLDDICVFDLQSRTWIQRRDYPRHCGTYRSIAIASNMTVRSPQDDVRASHASSTLGNPGTRFRADKNDVSSEAEFTPSESLVHLPYSASPSEDYPCDIYLYSNYNFTDVKRELEVLSPLPEADFMIQDRSSTMTGSTFPPGLRFPNGAILGTHLIIAGTYLAHSYQSFSIWVLDLVSMTWSRIDPGKALETGSWFRACLWGDANKYLIFGNRNGNLVEDYNRRLLSWDHVAVVDLEAFGIYQPPSLRLDLRMQEFGLAALEEQVLTDFELICDDGRRIPCSRKLLDDRWPWFREQRIKMLQMALSTSETLPTSSMHTPLPPALGTTLTIGHNATRTTATPDPRLTPRAFNLSEPYPITLAFLQYFYTQALVTPLQHAPAVLSQLLLLSTVYNLSHLEALVRHAMHRMLNNSTSVAVYEVATLCSCRSLQIRALKTVMSYTQKKPVKTKGDSGGGSGGGIGDSGKPGGGGSGNDSETFTSRPRGTSDAKWRTMGDSGTVLIDGGRTNSASRTEKLVPRDTPGKNNGPHHSRSNSDMLRREPRHQRNANSTDSMQSDSSDSFRVNAWHDHIPASAGPQWGINSLAQHDTHSRNSSSSTDHSVSDYAEPLQSGSGFRTRAQSVSTKLATVAEQENGQLLEGLQEQAGQQQGGIKTRPRAQSAAGQLLRHFPVPPTSLRTMASMTQLSQKRSPDDSIASKTPQMNPRSSVHPGLSLSPPTPVKGIPSTMKEPGTSSEQSSNGFREINNWDSTNNNVSPAEVREGDTYQAPYTHSFTYPSPSLKTSTYTSNRVLTSSYSGQPAPGGLHTPADSLSGSPLGIITEHYPETLGGDANHMHDYNSTAAYDGIIDAPTKPSVPSQDIPRMTQKDLRHLTIDNVSPVPIPPQTLTPSSTTPSTSHSPITPSSSQSSLQRLLAKVSLGKDSHKDKDGNVTATSDVKRKKRDDASVLGLVGFSLS
ncbi:hypothetical protein AX15_000018 [Amanita polypyramis BW_CC]|nr:hypothetical protein AX15_000018 [Amanita polypyramis BW_CC]